MTPSETLEKRAQEIRTDGDVILARQLGRELAATLEFGKPDQALVATAISELARNIVNYAGHGRIEIQKVTEGSTVGIRVVAKDTGPGIDDIDAAMIDGYSTGRSLGLGLPGTKRIVDEFDIQSPSGEGVTVTFIKWKFR